jgi:hypothetical protein
MLSVDSTLPLKSVTLVFIAISVQESIKNFNRLFQPLYPILPHYDKTFVTYVEPLKMEVTFSRNVGCRSPSNATSHLWKQEYKIFLAETNDWGQTKELN